MGGEMTIFDNTKRADHRDIELAELREENKKLARALQDANVRGDRAEEDTTRALSALRRQLKPLYSALQAVFGELDAAGVGDAPQPEGASAAPRNQAVWEAWKKRLGGKPSQLIDALLLHGEMSSAQIAIAIQCHPNSVPQIVYKLNKAGLLNKNGGRFSLKQL